MKKTVLVTGSSRGIGRAVALKFASCGYHVVINCARSTERMEEVKKEVEALGAECLAVQAYKAAGLLVQGPADPDADVILTCQTPGFVHKGC